jgi:hypothetical protein
MRMICILVPSAYSARRSKPFIATRCVHDATHNALCSMGERVGTNEMVALRTQCIKGAAASIH